MKRKNIISGSLFLAIFLITVYVIFKNNDMAEVWQSIKQLQKSYLFLTIGAALFFVAAEGLMIWYLLRALSCKTKVKNCILYSFVGFFFSGLTPSASGGQPMQLYYMKKAGIRISDSTVVLMVVALIYKFVLVTLGILILPIFWQPLHFYLGNYIYLYYLGLSLNIIVVGLLLFVMISPQFFTKLVLSCEKLLLRIHILKPSTDRTNRLYGMTENYHQAVMFFLHHKKHIVYVTIFTFIQRCSLFILTWLVYRGLGLSEHGVITIMTLQASIYIAVDMLPLPGAQGITELMYKTVFHDIFTGTLLTASMCVTRGINFYLLLILSGLITAIHHRTIAKKA